jgi:hypothetical protein
MIEGIRFLEANKTLPGLELPVRSAVIELEAGRVLWSPGSRLTEEQLRGAGAITDIVAPSLPHTGGMKRAAAAHPSARLWGPAGVREKLPELKWHGLLGVDAWPHERELSRLPIDGMPQMREHVFLHRRSRTLLVSDLVFNIREPRGWGSRPIYSLFGTYRRFAVSRLFLSRVKDREAFKASLQPISQWEFEAVVPSHGEPVEGGGKPKLMEAFRERGLV